MATAHTTPPTSKGNTTLARVSSRVEEHRINVVERLAYPSDSSVDSVCPRSCMAVSQNRTSNDENGTSTSGTLITDSSADATSRTKLCDTLYTALPLRWNLRCRDICAGDDGVLLNKRDQQNKVCCANSVCARSKMKSSLVCVTATLCNLWCWWEAQLD